MLSLLSIALAVSALFLALSLVRSQRTIHRQKKMTVRLRQEKKIVFDFLHDLGEAFVDEIDRKNLLNIILSCSCRVTGARGGAIYQALTEPKPGLVASSVNGNFLPLTLPAPGMEKKILGSDDDLRDFLHHDVIDPASENPVAVAFRNGEPLLLENGLPEHQTGPLKIRSLIAVPLKYRSEKLGVLALINPETGKNFTESDYEIARSIGDQASFSLHNATVYTQLSEKKRIDRDLETAREIQRILLPEKCPTPSGYDIAAINIPAQQVSGDYYDFIEVDQDRIGITIADVSGKGVPASLIMAMVRTVMRTQAPGKISAAEVLRQANQILYPDIREDMFITMVYMILNTRDHNVTMAKAGHDSPMLCSQNGKKVEALQCQGMALGIDSGSVFDMVIHDLVVPLAPDDTILVYTDGVNEAIDEDGQEFGRDNVAAALKESASRSAESLVQDIVDRVARFRGSQTQNDDITLVTLQRK